MFSLFFSHNQSEKCNTCVLLFFFQDDKFWLHRQGNGEMQGTALHVQPSTASGQNHSGKVTLHYVRSDIFRALKLLYYL